MLLTLSTSDGQVVGQAVIPDYEPLTALSAIKTALDALPKPPKKRNRRKPAKTEAQ